MQFAAAKYKITYTALSVSIVCIFSEFIGFILIVFQHPLFRDLYLFFFFTYLEHLEKLHTTPHLLASSKNKI